MKILANLREKSQKWFDELARRAPARLTLVIFLCIIAVFSGLLMLPIATVGMMSERTGMPLGELITKLEALIGTYQMKH